MHLKWYQELHGMWHEIGQASLFRAKARPIHAKTELKHTERGTQHCNNGRPTPVCDPYRPNHKYSLVPVSNSYSLVIHEGSPPQFPCRTWTGAPEDHLFFHFSNYSTPTYVVIVLFVVNERSKLHAYSAEIPVLHTPVEVTFSITCRFVDGQGKRGNGTANIYVHSSTRFSGLFFEDEKLYRIVMWSISSRL